MKGNLSIFWTKAIKSFAVSLVCLMMAAVAGAADTSLVWLKSRTAAFTSAQEKGKKIFLISGRESCGNTTATRDSSCANAKVRTALSNYVLWFCNCDKQFDELRPYVSDKESFALPVVCVIDPSDPDHYIVRKFGYQTASQIISILGAANPQTVTFNANGGEVGEQERKVAQWSAVGKLPTPKRGKYTFVGWYTAISGGTKISSSTKVNTTVTYYAHWAAPWKVTLSPNGGSLNGEAAQVLVMRGKAVGTLVSPVRTGYAFKGWFTKKSGGTKITSKTKVTKSVTWYAQWTPKKYAVKVVKVGSGTVSGTGNKAYKSSVTLTAKAAKGYVFQGWYQTVDGEDVLRSKKASYPFKVPLNGVTYKANFITTAADKAGIGLKFAGTGVGSYAPEASLPVQTNVCGVAIDAQTLATTGLTATSVTVSGLPSGLKYDSEKKAIVGTPTAIKTFTAKITVKSLGASRTWNVKWVIVPIPEWARGTFTGTLFNAESTALGTFSLTVGKTGKVSGKFVNLKKTQYPYSVGSFKSLTDSVLTTKASMKYGSKTLSVEIAVGHDVGEVVVKSGTVIFGSAELTR